MQTIFGDQKGNELGSAFKKSGDVGLGELLINVEAFESLRVESMFHALAGALVSEPFFAWHLRAAGAAAFSPR